VNRGWALTILVLGAIAFAGFLVYTRIIQEPPKQTAETVVCTNANCHIVFEVKVPQEHGGAPYKCPKCLEKSAHLAFQCLDRECAAIFAVTSTAMNNGDDIVCPVCGELGRLLLPPIPEDADALAEKGLQ